MAIRRGIGLVLTFIGMAVVVSTAAILLLYLTTSRGPAVPGSATLVLRPGGDLRETAPEDVVGQVLGRDAPLLRGFAESLRMAARDPRITSVLLAPSTLNSPFWAKVQELRDAVLEFRTSGKPIVAFLEYGGDREYYLATAADQIFLLPTSPLDLTGVASHEIFLRGALDKVGAYADFLQIGEYKTAPNQYTRSGFTPAHREMSESLNREMYEQLVSGIAEARGKSEDDVRALLDQGPFAPEDARRAGLVDDLAYLDQIDDRVPALRSAAGGTAWVEGADYQRVSPRSVGIVPRSRIAVIYAVGIIASGRSGYDPVNGPVIGSDTIVEQIRRVRDDDSIKAIVVRVDSPGGSSVASDVIWRELSITRDAAPSRPLIASMSDLAASGGYYIAMPAQAIVAQPATLTGSIGIYAGKFAVGDALNRLGVTAETVQSGQNADINSPFAPFTPAQRATLQRHLQAFYADFLAKAAKARGKTTADIDAVAQGRVWTGRQARDRGLVDALGGLDVAVDLAKARANIPADEDVELVVYPPRRTFYDAVAAEFRSGPSLWDLLGLAPGVSAPAALVAPTRLFRRGEPLALMPFGFVR